MSKKKAIQSRIIETKPIKWRELQFLQDDNFKDLTPERKEKLRASIIENNFADPFTVWLETSTGTIYCMDGKHRSDMLDELSLDGYKIPEELPATFIRCKDKQEAAKLVLVYSSMYAVTSTEGLYDFLKGYQLDINDLRGFLNLPEIDLEKLGQLPDYSGINQEIDTEGFADTMELKLVFTREAYLELNQAFYKIMTEQMTNSKEQVIFDAVISKANG